MKHEILSSNTFSLVPKFQSECSSSIKKFEKEKIPSDSKNIIASVLINNICYS